jgi:hypothetical protein
MSTCASFTPVEISTDLSARTPTGRHPTVSDAGQHERPDRHRLGHVQAVEHMLLVHFQTLPSGVRMAATVHEPVVSKSGKGIDSWTMPCLPHV